MLFSCRCRDSGGLRSGACAIFFFKLLLACPCLGYFFGCLNRKNTCIFRRMIERRMVCRYVTTVLFIFSQLTHHIPRKVIRPRCTDTSCVRPIRVRRLVVDSGTSPSMTGAARRGLRERPGNIKGSLGSSHPSFPTSRTSQSIRVLRRFRTRRAKYASKGRIFTVITVHQSTSCP